MAKEKKESETYYNPKKGVMVDYKPSKKAPIVEYIDLLSKLKTDTIEIRPTFMRATSNSTSMKVLIGLGVDCKVDRKEFKKIVRYLEGTFTTTLIDNTLEFAWGQGNVTSIQVEPNPEIEKGNLGDEVACFKDNDFYHSLFSGGSSVATDRTDRLGFIHYDGLAICSTDNVMVSWSEFVADRENACDFLLSNTAFKLWKDVNLPTKYICVYEKGSRIMIREDIIITDNSNHDEKKPFNVILDSKISSLRRFAYKKFRMGSDIWKRLSMFKDCKEITIKNNEICVLGSASLKISTNIVPFDDPTQSFTIKTKEFFRLESLVTSNSDLSIAVIDVGTHLNKYLFIDPDPGIPDTIILGGIAEEKENV